MQDILDLYAEPYQPAFPVICFDEVTYQMIMQRAAPVSSFPDRLRGRRLEGS
jgi:hypothetical protein